MTKNVTFRLGLATGISTRTLTIRPMPKAGDDVIPVASVHSADAGAVETVVVALDDNQIFQAELVDVMTAGETRPTQSIQFHTASLQHLGPKATFPAGSEFSIYSMEDLSSSSNSSSSSISTSSSSSSSISTSSSSISTSSNSSSSQSSSSQSVSTSSSVSSGSSGLN